MANLSDIFLLLQKMREEFPAIIERSRIIAKQIVTVTGLSDISERLGLVQAGEFRTGNSKDPGYGFSGVRIGYPPFLYDSVEWNVVGVENDSMQFGLRSSDGVAVAGGGNVEINSGGIVILRDASATSFLSFYDPTGATEEYSMRAAADGMQILSRVAGNSISLFIKETDLSTPYIEWGEDPAQANRSLLVINADSAATKVTIGSDIVLSASESATETVFNNNQNDIDFRIKTDNVADAFLVNAGNDRVEFGADHYIPTRTSSNNTVIFNEANQDMDFKVEGSTDGSLLYVDAGNDRVGIGDSAPSHKLDVTGDINFTGKLYHNSLESAAPALGWQAYATPDGVSNALDFSAGTVSVTANGGIAVVPIQLVSRMLLQSVSVWCTATATQRTWNWSLFVQYTNTGSGSENTLSRIAVGASAETFTPSAASLRTITAASAPVTLTPGTYWLGIQSQHATSAFAIGNAGATTILGPTFQHKVVTNPVGTTLDMVAATWSKFNGTLGVRLNGRVFGQTSAF